MIRLHKKRTLRTTAATCAALGLLTTTVANAQVMLFIPQRMSGTAGTTLTFNVAVDGGIQNAVGWGTEILLGNNRMLEFVPDFGGTGKPFLSTQSFFDLDLSPTFAAGSANLNLSFLNLTEGATFGQNSYVILGQFQLLLKNDSQTGQQWIYPSFAGVPVNFSDIGIPPDGSSIQDQDGNNMLLGLENAIVTPRPPSPEPSGWLAMLGGTGMAYFAMRRRRSRA